MTTEPASAAPKSVMIVEDNDLVADTLRVVLSRKGLSPIVSNSVREALELSEAAPVGLLITDVMMPQWGRFQPRIGESFSGCGGLELIGEMRRRWPETKIIAITAGGERMVERARLAGAHRVLEKPFAHGLLLEAIFQLVPHFEDNATSSSR